MFKKKNNNSNPTKDSNNSAKSRTDQISSDILKSYGLEDEPNIEYAQEAPTVEPKQNDEVKVESKTPIPSHADTIGWNKPKVLFTNLIYGLFMGFSDSVPGYSGGTTLAILGFYEKLIHNLKLIFKPDVKKYFWKYLLWVLPFIIAWVGVLIGFMKLVDIAGANNMGIVFVFLFGGLALFSIPLFYVTNKQRIVISKDFISATKAKEKWTIIHWVMLCVGFLIMLAVGLTARFVPYTLYNGEAIYGMTFVTSAESWNINNYEPMQILFILIAGFFAGFCMLIPGISGGLILFATGWYPKIAQAISNVLVNPNFLPWLVVLALGIGLGLLTAVFTINMVLKRWEKIFYSLSLGLVSGGFISIFVAVSAYEYSFLADGTTLGLCIAMFILSFVFNILIFIFMNQTGRINYPRFKINKFTKAPAAQA